MSGPLEFPAENGGRRMEEGNIAPIPCMRAMLSIYHACPAGRRARGVWGDARLLRRRPAERQHADRQRRRPQRCRGRGGGSSRSGGAQQPGPRRTVAQRAVWQRGHHQRPPLGRHRPRQWQRHERYARLPAVTGPAAAGPAGEPSAQHSWITLSASLQASTAASRAAAAAPPPRAGRRGRGPPPSRAPPPAAAPSSTAAHSAEVSGRAGASLGLRRASSLPAADVVVPCTEQAPCSCPPVPQPRILTPPHPAPQVQQHQAV